MADPLAALDDGSDVQKLAARFHALLIELAYTDAADTLGVDIAFDLANPRIQDVLGQLAAQVTHVTETTKAQIQALVGQAAAEGWSSDELAAAIRETGATESATRSRLIARTEAATAYTHGSLLAYADSQVVDRVEWLTGGDACDTCAPLAGQRVALGALFAGEYAGPPAHPACRCAVAPVLIGQE